MIDFGKTIELSIRDRKDPMAKALKCAEEMGELAQAVLSFSGAHACAYRSCSKDDIVEEAADVIQCAISVIAKTFEEEGFPKEQFAKVYADKLEAWEKKQKAEM